MSAASQPQQSRRKGQFACDFCKIRKLRCNRPFPCTNCRSRGKACRIDMRDKTSLERGGCAGNADTVAAPASVLQPSPLQRPDALPTTAHAELHPPLPEDILNDIQALRRMTQQLEERVLQSITNHQRLEDPITLTPEYSTASEGIITSQPNVSEVSDVVAHLQHVSMSKSSFDTTHADDLVLKIGHIRTISEASTCMTRLGKLVPCIWLPYHAEAKILVDSYIEEFSCIQHIVHPPSLPAIIDAVYRQLDNHEPVNPGHLVLFLSIVASAIHVWVPRVDLETEHSLYLSSAQANAQTPLWIEATYTVIHATQNSSVPTLDMIQGIIILSFIVANLEGVSMRYRSLISTALLLSREMNLHRLDQDSDADAVDTVRSEMSRRVWWYLVATDWLIAARYGGPGEGVYQCHPLHMQVRKPRNIDDADLMEHNSQFEHPPSHPTDMSYFLQRIRLAETARSLVDRSLQSPSHFPMSSANTDRELAQMIDNLPPFFRLSTYNPPSTSHRNSNIFIQAYMLTSLIHTQRCKTHLTHLTSIHPSPSASRTICLQSARQILNAERLLLRSHHSFVRVRMRLAGILYGIFIACIALLMDTCIHRRASLEHDLHHGDVADALSIVDEARGYSLAAEKVWQGLMGVVDKYRGKMPRELDGGGSGIGDARERGGADVARRMGSDDSIARDLGHEAEVETREWYDLFSDLSSSSSSSFF